VRPAWVEVETKAITENVQSIRKFVGEKTGVIAVVKADGYGHGLIPSAKAVLEGGATMLAVAIPEEVKALHNADVYCPTLIMGCSLPCQAEEIVHLDSAAVINCLKSGQAFSDAAVKIGKPFRAHIKVNTGMGRVGVRWSEAAEMIRKVAAMPGIEIEGIMTHFATADYDDQTSLHTQFDRFCTILDNVAKHGITPRYRHCANSAAVTFFPPSHLDMVRPGLIMYGITPVPMASDIPPETGMPALYTPTKRVNYARERTEDTRDRFIPFPLRPALSLKSQVVQVNNLPAGDAVGYGLTYRTHRDSKFALLPLGYADGLARMHSNTGWALIHNERALIAGRVSMDQTIIDVTDIPDVMVGDTAVLIGSQGDKTITAWEVGMAMGSIAYEALVSLGVRLPRLYI